MLFRSRLCDRAKLGQKGVADEFFEHLHAYDWPGNVRELQQTLEQVFANAVHHPTLYAYHLPEHIRVHKTLENIKNEAAQSGDSLACAGRAPLPTWKDFKSDKEREYLRQLLEATQSNIKDACLVSGLSRARLYQLISLHGIGSAMQEPE
mgnify:FL=1